MNFVWHCHTYVIRTYIIHIFYVDITVHIKYILQAEAWTLFVCLQASFSTHINQLRVNGPDNRVNFLWVQLEDTLGLVQEENKRIDNPINVHARSLAFLCPKVCSVSNIACWIIQNTSSVLFHKTFLRFPAASLEFLDQQKETTAWIFTTAIHCQDLQMLSSMKKHAGSTFLHVSDI